MARWLSNPASLKETPLREAFPDFFQNARTVLDVCKNKIAIDLKKSIDQLIEQLEEETALHATTFAACTAIALQRLKLKKMSL